jgi:hypothetical protein
LIYSFIDENTSRDGPESIYVEIACAEMSSRKESYCVRSQPWTHGGAKSGFDTSKWPQIVRLSRVSIQFNFPLECPRARDPCMIGFRRPACSVLIGLVIDPWIDHLCAKFRPSVHTCKLTSKLTRHHPHTSHAHRQGPTQHCASTQ